MTDTNQIAMEVSWLNVHLQIIATFVFAPVTLWLIQNGSEPTSEIAVVCWSGLMILTLLSYFGHLLKYDMAVNRRVQSLYDQITRLVK